MANYTITAQSVETRAQYYAYGLKSSIVGENWNYQDDSFNIPLPDLTGAIIKSVVVTAPVISTEIQGGYGNFVLKVGNSTLGTWNDSLLTTWSASNLSIVGTSGSSVVVDLKRTDKAHWKTDEYSSISYTGRVLGQATVTIVVEGNFLESITSPVSGQEIAISLDNTFAWTQEIFRGNVVSQKLFWKYSNESQYKTIVLDTTATSYTFPANTFVRGSIDWYVQGVDDSGNVATSTVETISVGIVPSVTIAYPKNVNIKRDNKQVFTWEMTESIATGQKSYTILYKNINDSDWTEISATSSNQYHEFEAGTFNTSTYQWKLMVTNNDNIPTQYDISSFVVIGATDSPNITNVTNSAIPTISWEISSQDTFELEIYEGENRIYSSGVQVGTGVRTFTPNIILNDGNYIIKMRAMNEYGFFTEWMDYAFVLNAEKPDALTCYAYANKIHGVTIAQSLDFVNTITPEISTANVPNAIYVIRRKYGTTKWDIIGKLSTEDSTVKYNDNTVITGIKYEYALRNFKEDAGFADSEPVSIIIEHEGSVIYGGNEAVVLYKTEDQQIDISYSPSKQYSYAFTIGRKYPVRESSEWISQSMTISCFVEFEQYEMLNDFYESNEYLWFKGDNFSYRCAIDSISIKETLWGKGYTLNLTISRVDEEELKLF